MQNEIMMCMPWLETASEQGTAHHFFRATLWLRPDSVFMGTAKNRWVTTPEMALAVGGTAGSQRQQWHKPGLGVLVHHPSRIQLLGSLCFPTHSQLGAGAQGCSSGFWGEQRCAPLLLQAAARAGPAPRAVPWEGTHISVR